MSEGLDRFSELCEGVGTRVVQRGDWASAADWILALAGVESVAIPLTLETAGHPLVQAMPSERRRRIRFDGGEALYGLAVASAAIVEVGGTVHEELLIEDRAVTMLSRTLTRVVSADRFVERLEDVQALLVPQSGPGFVSIITGASRTADIERALTIGVQGPVTDYVMVVG